MIDYRNHFVGREGELSTIRTELATERLVTICGAPGIGKTRLATEHVIRHPEPRALWCYLAEARTRSDVVLAVASAAGVEQHAGIADDDLLEIVTQTIQRSGPLLFVLDNFEQLVECAATTIGAWLDAASETSFLVTSREPLSIAGESLVRLGPLQEKEALALFVDRTRAKTMSTEHQSVVVEVVNTLDCIPLGIELAAAQITFLSPSMILGQLEAGRYFSNKLRDAPHRQSTLSASIEWSWQLLSPWEQEALAQLSSFEGSFSLDAAEAVVDVSHHSEAPSAAEVLSALCDKSLVLVRPDASKASHRYQLYKSIWHFSWTQLATLEYRDDVLLRHANYYISANSGPVLSESQYSNLKLERDNLRVAHERHLGTNDTVAVRAALALGPLLLKHGTVEFAINLLSRAVSAADSAAVTNLSVDTRLERAQHYCLAMQVDLAMEDLEWAKAAAGAEREHLRVCRAARYICFVQTNSDNVVAALASISEAIELAQTHGFEDQLAHAFRQRAHLHYEQGSLDAAEIDYREAISLHRKLGDDASGALDTNGLIGLLLDRGRTSAAIDFAQRGVEIEHAHGHVVNEAILLTSLGMAHLLEENFESSRASLERARELLHRAVDRRSEVIAIVDLGILAMVERLPKEAKKYFATGMEICRDAGFLWLGGMSQSWLGAAQAVLGCEKEAQVALRAGHSALAKFPNRYHAAMSSALLAYLDILACRSALIESRFEDARKNISDIESRLEPAKPLCDESHDLLIAVRCVEKEKAELCRDLHSRTLTVCKDTGWFAVGSDRVDLKRRRPLRLIVAALVHARVESPGTVVSLETLIRKGWPDQNVSEKSARNRLWVTINELRKLGLKDVLATRDDGYLLLPEYEVVIAEP